MKEIEKKLNKINKSDDVSDGLRDYYAKLSEEIIKLIKDDKLQEAIDKIDIELESPYVPSSIISMLCDTKNELEITLKNNEYEQSMQDISNLELWNKIYDQKKSKFDFVFFNILLEKNENSLDDVDLKLIEKVFLDKKIEIIDKAAIGFILMNLGLDHEFKVFNQKLDKEFVFNTNHESDNCIQIPNDELTKLIEDEFMKDPSRQKIAFDLLQILSSWYFPVAIEFDNDLVFSTIRDVTNSLFDATDYEENEITDILDSYINQ